MEETRSNESSAARRSLGAILITDAAGFSALASRDEARALDQLTSDMDIMRSCCARFSGRIVKSTGDGFLMFFDSAVLAVECALDIRSAMAVRTGEDLFQHRIGVHLGDVVLTADDAYGDGVNVASRLESAAKPGSVLISQTVFDVIRGKVACRSSFEGERSFKGLASRIPVWSVAPGEGVSGGPRRHTPTWALIATPVLLVVAILLAVNSAQVQGKAAEVVAKANAERDQLLRFIASTDGGVPMRQFDFPKMMNAVETKAKPNDPEAKVLVKKLEGLNTWKGWINKRLKDSNPQKPVEVAVHTPDGVQKAAVWNVKGKGLQFSDGHTVRTLEFKDFDPATLTALTDTLKDLEPEERRKQIESWSRDFKVIYGTRHVYRQAPTKADLKVEDRKPAAKTHKALKNTEGEVDATKTAAFDLDPEEFAELPIPDLPQSSSAKVSSKTGNR